MTQTILDRHDCCMTLGSRAVLVHLHLATGAEVKLREETATLEVQLHRSNKPLTASTLLRLPKQRQGSNDWAAQASAEVDKLYSSICS